MRMNTERFPRLWEMLSCGCPFVQPERDKVMREIFHDAVSELAGRPEAEYTDTQLLTAVRAGIGAYLQSYRAQPVFKQKIREKEHNAAVDQHFVTVVAWRKGLQLSLYR